MKLSEVIAELEKGSTKTYGTTTAKGTKIKIQKTEEGCLSLAGYLRLDLDWQPVRITSELKPCPFCGGEGKLLGTRNVYWVKCCECKADFGIVETPEEAAEAWNRRTEYA